MRRPGGRVAAALLAAAPALAAQEETSPPAVDASTLVARADAHYARRGSSRTGARASVAEIAEAVSLYERAAREPGNAEARWKLARALYFLGTYTGLDEAGQRSVFARARQAGEEALGIIAGRKMGGARVGDRRKLTPAAAAELLRGDPDSAPSLFWTAVAWGQWALASGKLDAARKGAASRIRDDCLTLIALDPAFEEGGGYRILGRLHDQAPKIPLVTGWVSRAQGWRSCVWRSTGRPATSSIASFWPRRSSVPETGRRRPRSSGRSSPIRRPPTISSRSSRSRRRRAGVWRAGGRELLAVSCQLSAISRQPGSSQASRPTAGAEGLRAFRRPCGR